MENLITAIVRAEHNRGIVAGIRNSLRALQERPLPFAIERLWFGPKEAQEHQEWPARCRQPIGFPRPARRIALNAQVHRGDLGDLESLPVVRTRGIINRLRRELGQMSDIVLPPVLPPANCDGPPNARNAFWSLTMYELPSRLLVANSLNRYLINSPMLPDLKRDADGGLTLYTGGDKGPGAASLRARPITRTRDYPGFASLTPPADSIYSRPRLLAHSGINSFVPRVKEFSPKRMRSFAASAVAKKLALGFALIALFSAILLLSDLARRKSSSLANSLPAARRNFKAAIVAIAPGVSTDLCANGMIEGLRQSGIFAGKNLEVVHADAQGEIINIPAILQNYDNSDADVIMTISTPCLAGACNKVKHKPVVFTCVSDPLAAGAGSSRTEHLPFLTGVGSFPQVEHHLDMMQKLVPGLRSVGTMYNPAEANSVKEISVAREIYGNRGIRLEEVPIAGSSELLQAVQILAGRNIQIVWVPGDNTCIEGYEGAVKGARDARLPLFTDICSTLSRGGLACLGFSPYDSGVASGKLAGRILLGANPKDLPIEEVMVEQKFISRSNADQLNITIPAELSANVRP